MTQAATRRESSWPYLLAGLYLGVVLVMTEAASWFRIQEMFRFHSIHMYGIIGSAVGVAGLGVWLLKRTKARTVSGHVITFPTHEDGRPCPQHWLGGIIFGLGWGILGACPGPIYALIGTGLWVMGVALVSALGGAWVYGLLRSRLPHS